MIAMLAALSLTASAAEDVQPRTKRPLVAAGLNFFVPGAGYLYNGHKPLTVSLPMIAGAAGLTYIEQFHQFEGGTLREQDPTAYAITFGAVFALNTGAAVDAWREARALNAGTLGPQISMAPAAFSTDDGTAYGLSLGVRY